MESMSLAEPRHSGKDAETGAELVKNFRRTSVQGGALRGARYSDVAKADIHKAAAKGCKGDPRFLQFCKQYVALEVVAAQPMASTQSPSEDSTGKVGPKFPWPSWKRLSGLASQWLRDRFRGRWLTLGMLTCICLIVITRPAFGRLCGRLIGLSFRLVIRRSIGIITTLVDSILEETVAQVEEALLPAPEDEHRAPARSPGPVQQTSTLTHFVLNIICMLIGSWLGRANPRAAQAVLPANRGT